MKTVYAVVMVPTDGRAGFMDAKLVGGTVDGQFVTYRKFAAVASSERRVPLRRQLTADDRFAGFIQWFDTPAEAVADYAKQRQQFVAAHNAHVAGQVAELARQSAEMKGGAE